MFAYCATSLPVEREQLQSMDPLDHGMVHRNSGVAAFAFGSVPIAAAVTFIDRDGVLSEIIPSQPRQLGYPQSGKHRDIDHRRVGLLNPRRRNFKLLRG